MSTARVASNGRRERAVVERAADALQPYPAVDSVQCLGSLAEAVDETESGRPQGTSCGHGTTDPDVATSSSPALAGRHEQVACPRPSLVVLSTHHAYAGAPVALRATPSVCTFDQQREASGLVAPLSPEQTRGGPRGVGAARCCWNTPHAAQLAVASAHLLTALMPGCPARGRRGQTSTRTMLRQCATDDEPPAKPWRSARLPPLGLRSPRLGPRAREANIGSTSEQQSR